jgi:hypothetical protein
MKLEITIPEKQSEIKLGHYQEFAQIEEPNDYDVLRCFYGIDMQGVFDMKDSDVARLVQAINVLLLEEPKELITSFRLGGQDFGFIPALDDMSYGENNDMTNYVNDLETMTNAMAVMYRPITKKQHGKYLIEKYEGSSKYLEIMHHAPLDVFLSAKVFFYDLTKDCLNYIPVFLQAESQQLSQENGEIMQAYINSLTESLQDLTKHPKGMSTSV